MGNIDWIEADAPEVMALINNHHSEAFYLNDGSLLAWVVPVDGGNPHARIVFYDDGVWRDCSSRMVVKNITHFAEVAGP